jgi:hypothetical protein
MAGWAPTAGRIGTVGLMLAAALMLALSGCSSMMTSAADDMAEDLSAAIENSNDPATVEAGAPAYLLLVDALIEGRPESVELLRTGADMYGTYAGVFVDEPERARRLTEKALDYGLRAMRAQNPEADRLDTMDFQEFEALLAELDQDDVPALYSLGAAWAGWIQARREDWNAVAQMPRVEAVMKRVVQLDEAYRDGGAHLYLGTMATLVPPAVGGEPEIGRRHFERAIDLSDGRNLMAKVLYARQYARVVFDRELHDRLLEEVLAAPVEAEGYTLANTLARREARRLLDDSDEYF